MAGRQRPAGLGRLSGGLGRVGGRRRHGRYQRRRHQRRHGREHRRRLDDDVCDSGPGPAGRLLHPVRGIRTAGLRGVLHGLPARCGQHDGGSGRHAAPGLRSPLGQPLGFDRRSQRPRESGRDRAAAVRHHQHRSGGRQLRAPGDQCSASQHPDPGLRCGFGASAGAGAAAAGRQGSGPRGPQHAGSGASAEPASGGSARGGFGGRRHLELPLGHHLRVGRRDGSELAHLADEHRGGGRRRSRLSVQRGRLTDGQHDRPRGHRGVGRGRRTRYHDGEPLERGGRRGQLHL